MEKITIPRKTCYLFQENNYLEIAKEAAEWIRDSAVDTEIGRYWRQNPDSDHDYDQEALFTPKSLYGGSAGIAIYFIRMYQVIGEERYLDEAKKAFRYILNTYEGKRYYSLSGNPVSNAEGAWDVKGFITGLYNGPAGSGILAEYLYQIEQDTKYRTFSTRVAEDLILCAKNTENGMFWSDESDFMSDGGLILYLVYMYRRTGVEKYLDAAIRAGQYIAFRVQNTQTGKQWCLLDMEALGFGEGRCFPNFLHGAAGVGYLFAILFQESGKEEFLELAIAAAEYVESLATGDENAILIPYIDPQEEELYYMGMCHGVAGTAKLFKKLYDLTKEERYKETVIRLTEGLVRARVDSVRSRGYWNNSCFCCGTSGIAEHFVAVYEFTGDEKYMKLAKNMADVIVGDAYVRDGKCRWYSAWLRNVPWKVESYTGLYVGGAGCASALLKVYSVKNGIKIAPYPEDLL